MLNIRQLDEDLRKNYCFHQGESVLLGGVEHCKNCGAVLSNVDHLYRIWLKCRKALKKGGKN